MGVMYQTVKRGGSQERIAEKFRPFFNGPVGGHNEGAAFIAFTDNLIKIVGSRMSQGLESPIVNYQQVRLEIMREFRLPGTVCMADGKMAQEL